LNNVRKALKFFEDIAERYGLHIDVEESDGVKGKKDLFEHYGKKEIIEMLVLLWGTEKVFPPYPFSLPSN